jgi:AcrR family transcriptional regulator
MFAKLGRPPEDRAKRRREIWAAVAPLIEERGARKLTMRQAAAAAFMSLGGLYHYFPNKRALVLFGLNPEALDQICADFLARARAAEQIDPDEATEDFVHAVADVTFIKRAALMAALELGTEESLSRLDHHINLGVVEGFIPMLRVAVPGGASDSDLRTVGKAVRQLSYASALDRSMSREGFEQELRALIRGVSRGQQRSGLAAAG